MLFCFRIKIPVYLKAKVNNELLQVYPEYICLLVNINKNHSFIIPYSLSQTRNKSQGSLLELSPLPKALICKFVDLEVFEDT